MAKKIILRGEVQGVFCRDYCSKNAKILKLRGAVSNLPDGTVEVILDTDNEQKINSFINSIKNNSFNIKFYGHITNIKINSYTGKVYGDYQF